ncbi:DUF3077 domain-containing protein [Pseudomonas soli]|uniref:DUF3077 domain-containing protein n=1 Tax=Pseudomonas soli TaxID=1306993 RepID=UPI0028A75F8A|nr:DUF3077 domain-containing protein [Pseudomonas soli]
MGCVGKHRTNGLMVEHRYAGSRACAESGHGGEVGVQDPLFRVVAGHPLGQAVKQATELMCTVHKISDLAMVETDHLPTLLTAVHYLSGMAKALAQDVNHGLTVRLPAE